MSSRQQTNFFIKVIMLAIVGVVIVAIVDMQVKMNKLANQRKELQVEIDRASDRVEEIKVKLKTPFDEDYMERLAREKLNYRNPNDIVFTNDITG